MIDRQLLHRINQYLGHASTFFNGLSEIKGNEEPKDLDDAIKYFSLVTDLLKKVKLSFTLEVSKNIGGEYSTDVKPRDTLFVATLIFYVIKEKVLERVEMKTFINYVRFYVIESGSDIFATLKLDPETVVIINDKIKTPLFNIFTGKKNKNAFALLFRAFYGASNVCGGIDNECDYSNCYEVLPKEHHELYRESCKTIRDIPIVPFNMPVFSRKDAIDVIIDEFVSITDDGMIIDVAPGYNNNPGYVASALNYVSSFLPSLPSLY